MLGGSSTLEIVDGRVVFSGPNGREGLSARRIHRAYLNGDQILPDLSLEDPSESCPDVVFHRSQAVVGVRLWRDDELLRAAPTIKHSDQVVTVVSGTQDHVLIESHWYALGPDSWVSVQSWMETSTVEGMLGLKAYVDLYRGIPEELLIFDEMADGDLVLTRNALRQSCS